MTVICYWIPMHIDTNGNAKADALAKQSFNLPIIKVQLTKRDFKLAINRLTKLE